MKRLLILVCAIVAVAVVAVSQDVKAKHKAWQILTERTETPHRFRYSEDGATMEWIDCPGIDSATAIAEIHAITQEQIKALTMTDYRVQLWTTLTNAVKKRLALSPPFTQAHADSAKPWVAADMETQRRIKKANDTTSAAYKAAADKLDYDQAIFNSYRALLEFPDFDLTTEHAKQEASP